MKRACLLLGIGGMVCLAQDQGFVNKRLLKADFLKSKAPAAVTQLPKAPCVKIPLQERLPTRVDVDRSMVIWPKGPSPDPLMIIWPAPICQ